MEKEILESRVQATPIGDFNWQSKPIDPNNCYLISQDEIEKLGKHELKWSSEVYYTMEDAVDENGDKTGDKLEVGHSRPILIPNDPTEENTRNLARQRIAELQDYLAKTDYIVTKIAEAETEEEKQALRNDEIYAKKLVLRKQWRKDINELEEYLNEESHID